MKDVKSSGRHRNGDLLFSLDKHLELRDRAVQRCVGGFLAGQRKLEHEEGGGGGRRGHVDLELGVSW